MAFRPRPRYLVVTCLLLCALFLSTAARLAAGPALASASSSTTLYAVADASVHSQHPNTNYGAENYLRLAYSSIDVPSEEALILCFNLTSLPAGAILDAVSLQLYLTYAAGAAPQPLVAWRVTSNWSEAGVTWNNFPTIEPQFGLAWSMDGVTGQYKPLDITAWAQYWYGNPGQNYGLFLRRPTGNSSYFERVFESKDHNEWMPRLVIDYHMPATPTRTTLPATRTPTRTLTRTPTMSPTARPPTPTATLPSACPDLLVNGDFESGVLAPWQGSGATAIRPGRASAFGAAMVAQGPASASLSQAVVLPAGAGPATLDFWWLAENTVEQPEDHLHLYAIEEGMAAELRVLPAAPLGQWRHELVDLTPFAGRLRELTFTAYGDASLPTTFRLDDIHLWACGVPTATPTPTPSASPTARTGTPTATVVRPTASPTMSPSASPTAISSTTPSASPTARTATATSTATRRATPSATQTMSPSASPTAISSTTPSASPPAPTATPTLPAGPLPDLLVTDIWNEGRAICYQIRNVGGAAAPPGHEAVLWVDGAYWGSQQVDVELEPGARWRGCFERTWECTQREDAVRVEADSEGAVAEGDESNNRREEVWLCDVSPPGIISGPEVLDITQDSARVVWETDEMSDSVVRYGSTARLYPLQSAQPALVTAHQVRMTGLQPATTYHFVVESADPGGNRVRSRDGTFATLPPDDDLDPTISLAAPGACQGSTTIAAAAADNAGVERVEFRLYDVSAAAGQSPLAHDVTSSAAISLCASFTDYSPPYEFQMDCATFANGHYSVTATAVDVGGRYAHDHVAINVAKLIDMLAPTVNLYFPSDGATVSGDQRVLVQISDDVGIKTVEFLLNNSTLDSFNYTTTPSSIHYDMSAPYWWETQYYANGSYTLTVRATDTSGLTGSDAVSVTVYNQESPFRPKLVVTKHEVTRHNNYFGVDLTVTNQGDAAASHIVIEDPLKAFQPVSGWDASHVVYYGAEWNPSSTVGTGIISDSMSLSAGQSRYYTFKALPVMVQSNAPTPSMGDSIELYYSGPYGTPYTDTQSYIIKQTTLTYPDVSIPTAHRDALAAANYLLVTNPGRMYLINVLAMLLGQNAEALVADLDDLLATMAHLAYLENGALGYVSSYSASTLASLIQPGGAWASQLSSSFSTSLGGYLLIVGETEWVPAFDIPQAGTGPLHHSDQPYSDTTGNDDVPELIVGRIIGDKYKDLSKALKTSIAIREGKAGYGFDHSHALVVAGGCGGENEWQDDLDSKVAILDDQFAVSTIECMDYFDLSAFGASFGSGDGFAAGHVTGDSRAEVIVGDQATDKIVVYSGAGTKIKDFSCGYGATEFASGDQLAVANTNIIMADCSADRILLYNWSGILQSSFSVAFDPGDGLATGDVMSDAYDEIVIADASADKVYVYGLNGAKQIEFSCSYGTQDKLAVGETMGYSKAQILRGDSGNGYVYVYGSSGSQLQSFDAKVAASSAFAVGALADYDNDAVIVGRPQTGQLHLFYYWIDAEGKKPSKFIPSVHYDVGFASGDRLASSDVTGGSDAEVLVADAASGSVDVSEPVCDGKLVSTFKSLAPNKDVIFFTGHGNPAGWCATVNTSELPASFGSTNPFVFGATCQSGNYDGNNDNSIGEAFFDSGASLYLGATVVSFDGWESDWFFKNWVNTTKSVGKGLAQTEKATIANHNDLYWVREYNLYGDPKLGGSASGSSAATPDTLEAGQDPPTFLEVAVPDYQVSTADGVDRVEIPGGGLLLVEGQPEVPLYTVSLDYPRGCAIQDVVLTDRSGLRAATGLNIPPVTRTARGAGRSAAISAGGWYPDVDYEWRAFQNAEGTATLVITVYPFYYNPLTTDVQFYQHYAFDIAYASSSVEVTALQTDRDVYPQGAPVLIDLALNNAGEAQDVVVNAAVKRYGSHEVVAGLLLRTLHGLSGLASWSLQWDSRGFEPDLYYVEAALVDEGGDVLDSRTALFTLGIASAEISGFSATPTHFAVGDAIHISLELGNPGTVPLAATVVIQVQNKLGQTIQSFHHDVPSVAPGHSIHLEDVWDTSDATEGTYTIVGYALYGSMTTDAKVAVVSTELLQSRIYLPVVTRAWR